MSAIVAILGRLTLLAFWRDGRFADQSTPHLVGDVGRARHLVAQCPVSPHFGDVNDRRRLGRNHAPEQKFSGRAPASARGPAFA
jgi:hypothetical protein